MVNSNFTAIASSSSGSSGGVTQLQSTNQSSNIVMCNGHIFDKRLAFNNGFDLWLACYFGIADKIWSKVKLIEANVNNQKMYYVDGYTAITNNNATGHCEITGRSNSIWFRSNMIIDISPTSITFIQVRMSAYRDSNNVIVSFDSSEETNPSITDFYNATNFNSTDSFCDLQYKNYTLYNGKYIYRFNSYDSSNGIILYYKSCAPDETYVYSSQYVTLGTLIIRDPGNFEFFYN